MAQIEERTEPFLQSRAQVFVLPVNSTGNLLDRVSNRCKSLYPDNHHAYRQACQRGELPAGSLLMHKRQREHSGLAVASNQNNPDYIANLLVSDHPYHPMRRLWLETSLQALAEALMRPIRYEGIRHIAMHCQPLIYTDHHDTDHHAHKKGKNSISLAPELVVSELANKQLQTHHMAEHQMAKLGVPVMRWKEDIKPIIVRVLSPLPKLRVDLHLPKHLT